MSWRTELESQHRQRREKHLWRQRQPLMSAQGAKVIVDGQPLINFCSNDYLGLACDPDLIDAATNVTRHAGTGSGASHLICGHTGWHHQLEQSLAQQLGAERALLFSTGYMANLAIPQAFLGRGDFLFQDRLNHASLLDASRLCDAKRMRYAHADSAALNESMQRVAQEHPRSRRMVTSDSVFSMDGDLAPLVELKSICDSHDALLVLDEAHGFGVLGESGNGAMELAGLQPRGRVLMVGTLGKACGSFGAFVAGDEVWIEQLIQHGRSYIYTTALPPAVAAATTAALDKIAASSPERKRLQQNIDDFQAMLNRLDSSGGIASRLLPSSTPIQPLLIGDSAAAIAASDWLRQQGLLVLAIRPPTVPVGGSRLRITLTAGHCHEDIDRLVKALCAPEMQAIFEAADQHQDHGGQGEA